MRISDWSSDVCSSDLIIVRQDLGRRLKRILRFLHISFPRHHADLGLASHHRSAFQIAKTEEEQIGRHSGSGGECHLCLAAAKLPAGLDRHVADGKLIRRNNGGQIEGRSEEHTSEPQSLMRTSYAVFCLKKKT